MSSTPTTVAIPSEYWSIKRYAIAGALVLALVAGAFGAGYLLTGTAPASSAVVDDPRFVPGVGLVEDAGEGGGGTGASAGVRGLVESSTTNSRSGAPGGAPLRGGIQP